MSERTAAETSDQPLFLDEPADTPRYRKPAGVPIEELFVDEDSLTANAPAASGQKPADSTKRPDTGGSTLALIFIVAAVLGFAAATALLR